jgi:hemoglobin
VARLSRVAGAEQTLFEELGGEAVLRGIVERFVDGVFADVMIGFMFARASRERIQAMEYEFAAQHLGAPVVYSGRPLAAAHRAHRIFDGQFDRRLTILRETLLAFGVTERVREHWLGHTEALRAQITLGACNEPLPSDSSR